MLDQIEKGWNKKGIYVYVKCKSPLPIWNQFKMHLNLHDPTYIQTRKSPTQNQPSIFRKKEEEKRSLIQQEFK